MKNIVFNFSWGDITVMYDEADEKAPSEMLIYDKIGKDPWTGDGITSDAFNKALNSLPTDRDVHFHINSKGGDVHHGMAMRNGTQGWKQKTGRKVISVIDGIAASTASWAFPTISDEVHAYKGSQMFCHDAMAFVSGNAGDLREVADNLDKTSDQIAAMYADKSGKSKKSMRDMMQKNSLLTGEEAKELGLVDKILDTKAVRNFTPQEIVNMTDAIAKVHNSVAKRGGETNNNNERTMKKRLIQMLNKHGVTEWEGKLLNEDSSDEHIEAALATITNKLADDAAELEKKKKAAEQKDSSAETLNEIKELRQQISQLTEANNAAKTLRITNAVDQLVGNDQLTEKEKAAALARCLKDETFLNELRARPAVHAGSSPLKPLIECVGNSFNEIQNYVLENGPRFMRNFIGNKTQDGLLGPKVMEDIRDHGIVVANTIKKHKPMLVEMFNTNTIDAGLQRQIILQEMLEEFAVVLAPLSIFSTVFSNVPLEGTDEVDVPFYPLATDAGNSWDPAVGYASNLLGDTATNTRPVVVGGSGVNSGANAAANTAKDRKWIGAAFSSFELSRQPYLNVQKLMVQKSNRLAVLIFKDIISRVITAANFGASVKAVAAALFTPDDIADLWETATGRNWPDRGRGLVLTHKYKTPLLKDVTFKQYLAAGTTDALRKAQIQEAYGFEDIPIVPNLDTYSPAGENLVGFICWMYAVLVATAPIMPTAEVRALMTRYDVVVHPTLGIAFEYRRFGDTTLDQTKEIVESSYGANKGVASALARLTSQ